MNIKRIFIVLLILAMTVSFIGCSSEQEQNNNAEQAATTRTITDMAGRSVTIPAEINKVYATHSIGTLFVYTIEPEKVVGWNFELEADKEFIKPEYYNLPVLGRWKGTNSSNIEEILKVNPDIIINMGDVTEGYIAESNEIEELLNIPVIMVDGSIAKQADSYEFLGNILGAEDRANKLADYSREVFNTITEKAEAIKDEDKKEVYYGAGLNGLETIPQGSINTEVLDLVGGINIADPGVEKDLRRLEISMEQLLDWNPELIILSSNSSHNEGLYEEILSDEAWQNIDAVKNMEIYEIPYGPFDWFSQPPTLLRIMGLQWLGDLLYPDIYQIDIKDETKEFFNLFFDYQMTDEQIDTLLENTIRE